MKKASTTLTGRKVMIVKRLEGDLKDSTPVFFRKSPPWPIRIFCCPLCYQRHPRRVNKRILEYHADDAVVEHASYSSYCPVLEAEWESRHQLHQNRIEHEKAMQRLARIRDMSE